METTTELAESEEDFIDLSELFARLSGFDLINGMTEHSVAESSKLVTEEAEPEAEPEADGPGLKISFSLKIGNAGSDATTTTSSEDVKEEEDLATLLKNLQKTSESTAEAEKELDAALTNLGGLKEQMDQIDKLFGDLEKLIGQDSDEDSSEEEQLPSIEPKTNSRKSSVADVADVGEDCDDVQPSGDIEELLSQLDDSSIKIAIGDPSEPLRVQLLRKASADSAEEEQEEEEEEDDDPSERIYESMKHIVQLEEDNEQVIH